MGQIVTTEILIPAIIMAVLGWMVPQRLARVMPEGVKALCALAVIAFVLLWIMSGVIFGGLYASRGADFETMWSLAGMVVLARSGLMASIIWLPLMIVSVANLPRKWVKETW